MMVSFAPSRPMKVRESVIPFGNNAAFFACLDGYEWHGRVSIGPTFRFTIIEFGVWLRQH
jgi:hypothetical protein